MHLISFNSAMLAAVLAGHKTVTRRRLTLDMFRQEPSRYRFLGMEETGAVFEDIHTATKLLPVPCPFSQPGDMLQVQEDPTLLLQVASIRAEQVRSLRDGDALAEGIDSIEKEGRVFWGGVEPDPGTAGGFRWYDTPTAAFRGLLDSIYPTAWARNEWVWVVEFRQIS